MNDESKNTGGPAFPGDRIEQQDNVHFDPTRNKADIETIDVRVPQAGMTLRDYFAAHAPPLTGVSAPAPTMRNDYLRIVVDWNYQYADAMLAEREKENTNG